MEIKKPIERPNIDKDSKLHKKYLKFRNLIAVLEKQTLNDKVIAVMNEHIEIINAIAEVGKPLEKQMRKSSYKIVTTTEKELKLVAKKHYLNTWLVLGMSTFGIPLGVIFSVSIENMAFIGVGMPVGMIIGMALGSSMDKKAYKEGRQLDFEM